MNLKMKPKPTSQDALDSDFYPILKSFVPPSYFNDFYRKDEAEVVAYLLSQIQQTPEQSQRIAEKARQFVEGVREQKLTHFSIENFLQTYNLNSQEGLVLMCLAEALLRVPDTDTKTRLIRDKIGSVEWASGKIGGKTFIAKLTGFGLSAADHLMHWGLEKSSFLGTLKGLTRRVSEPIIRQSIAKAMEIMGNQFVMGETIKAALRRAKTDEIKGYRHSYDMLGEEARTKKDADRYFRAYTKAIEAIGKSKREGDVFAQNSISVKLSALHPRYELAKRERINAELKPLVLSLALLAKEHGIGLTIDAEESERLDISLDTIEFISGHEDLKDWNGFGLAVQAYQKRAPLLIDYLIDMAQRHERRLCIRLVKGAYWDSEIKRTQEKGLKGYSVFTRKAFTDICYQVCAQKMFAAPEAIYPQFATHNARTVATILELAGENKEFEFQRLHGMGEALYGQIMKEVDITIPCRVYAPVGEYKDLLAYLVRRLLENGANTSFVHKIYDPSIPIKTLIADPVEEARSFTIVPHPKIPLPLNLWRPQRQNSEGIDLNNAEEVRLLNHKIGTLKATMPTGFPWCSAPLISGAPIHHQNNFAQVVNPANNEQVIGQVWNAKTKDVEQAMAIAEKAFEGWGVTPVGTRALALENLAALLEKHREELMALLIYEGGKTLPDAISEVREAADFCRYYAAEARRLMSAPLPLPGPTGEKNQLSLHGRGIFVCISPWNFPLAIFIGQVAAALAAGNCVLAKPAHQTPLVGYRAVQLAYQAGIPANVLHYLPGRGSVLGPPLLRDERTAGVAFTGSTAVAQGIAKALLAREKAPIVPLIAETGGMNTMIVDSSALPEQVIQDIIVSSFQSAGQRCSALRLLFVQEEIADTIISMLQGAMAELSVGNPSLLSTDVGPVIDHDAEKSLQAYGKMLEKSARLIHRIELDTTHQRGNFIAPQAWELASSREMTEEVFGPILHIVRFKGADLDKVIDEINATGYGLTLGVHSRIDATIGQIRKRSRVGNLYVNRSMIGAVVGVQPFGGEGLSGTGPKAGGPNYLIRFMVERTFSQDTTAAGGNATLLAELE